MRSESQVSFLLRFICLREYKLDEKYFRNNFYLKYNFNIIYFCFLVHPEHYLLTISFSRQIHFKNNKYSYKSEFYFILNFLSLATKWCATRQHHWSTAAPLHFKPFTLYTTAPTGTPTETPSLQQRHANLTVDGAFCFVGLSFFYPPYSFLFGYFLDTTYFFGRSMCRELVYLHVVGFICA